MGMVRIFKCVWKKPLMLIYMVNLCTTTKIWMYNWVLQTQEMLVVKQVLGIAKKICMSQAESRSHFLHIGKFHAVFTCNRSRLECWLVWSCKKKNLTMYLRGSMPVMPLWPSQKPYWVYTYRESNFISFNLCIMHFTLLKTQGDWQGHIWDVNKLQHKHQLSLSGMASSTACRNHIDMPVCAQITMLFNIPREILH